MVAVDLARSVRELERADDAELPAALGGFLGKLARRLGADRVSLAAGADPDGQATLRFEYVAPGLEPSPSASEPARSNGAHGSSFEVVYAPRVAELPPSLEHLRVRYQRGSVQSAITAAIRDGADPIGRLEVQAVRSEQPWGPKSADEVGKLAAELLPTVRRLTRQARAYVYRAPEPDLAMALDLAERRYAAVADDSGQLVGRVWPDLRLTDVNGPSCAYTGLPREGLVDMALSDIIHPEDYEELLARLRSLTQEDPRVTLEFRAYSPRDGEYRWHRATCRALFDRDGQLVEYQAVGTDITRQVRVAGDVVRELGLRSELDGRLRLLEALFGLMEKAHGVTAEKALARVHGPDNPLPVLVLRLVRSVLSGTWDEEAEAGIRGLAKARRTVDRFLSGRGDERSIGGDGEADRELIDLATAREERERSCS